MTFESSIDLTLPGYVLDALSVLERGGAGAFAVGGCVRDLLRGAEPGDYDVTTCAPPERVTELFDAAGWKCAPTGVAHGTVTVICEAGKLEVTTYRRDGEYADHRRPDSVRFTGELQDDLARRDFTVNAMAYSPGRGLADPFGGRDDLRAGVIRCVGDPDARFGEDALRIVRAARFASTLDFAIDRATADAMQRSLPLLKYISGERIGAELLKLLCGAGAARVLRERRTLFAAIIPSLGAEFDFEQHSPYHIHDVWEHTVAVVGEVRAEPVLRLAALLHDVGKPGCFTRGTDGVGHFYGHAEAGAKLAYAALRALKLDAVTIARVTELVRLHMLDLKPERKIIRRRLGTLTPPEFFDLIELQRADALAHEPAAAVKRLRELERAAELARGIIADGECCTLRQLAIGGDELVALGLPPGPEVGRILRRLLREVTDGKLANERGALMGEAGRLMGR